MGLLDFLFPKYCVSCKRIGEFLCPDCFSLLSFDVRFSCCVCNRPSLDGLTHPVCLGKYTIDGTFASITYNKIARKLLYSFKYKPYISRLDELLGKLFYEGIIQHEGFTKFLKAQPVLVPIPLHGSKLHKRGYNHAALLANYLAIELHLQSVELLTRTKPTLSQYGLNRVQRLENIKGAFALKKVHIEVPRSVLLVDDIVTTGATFSEAAKVLKRGGVKQVFGIALARD